MAFHPQSDLQTERVNRVLEEMLRHYAGSARQDDWHVYLPMAEFAINTASSASTGFSTFSLNYARPQNVSLVSQKPGRSVPKAERVGEAVQHALVMARQHLQAGTTTHESLLRLQPVIHIVVNIPTM
eukprot:17786-Chlamydomonas_euryale.AAC.4